jgi:hypothetical protein
MLHNILQEFEEGERSTQDLRENKIYDLTRNPMESSQVVGMQSIGILVPPHTPMGENHMGWSPPTVV